MPYTVWHEYVNYFDSPGVDVVPGHPRTVRVDFSTSGDLPIRHPGLLRVFAQASYWIETGEPPTPPRNTEGAAPVVRPKRERHDLPLTTRIFSPDGSLFTADHVTIADLERFRDLRESSQGLWRYEISGASAPIFTGGPNPLTVEPGLAKVGIGIEETTTSKNAGPLVSASGGTAESQTFSFDLFRVGRFVAEVRVPLGTISRTARLRLIDPDGVTAASASQGFLSFDVTLRTLDKSRDAKGQVRQWRLEVTTVDPGVAESISATVVASARVPVSLVQSRIDDLLGPHGNKLSVFGQNIDGYARCRLKDSDEFSAETIDIHDLLDKVIQRYPQDQGVDTSTFLANVAYTIAQRKQDVGYGVTLDVSGIRITTIDIRIGPSQHTQPPVPSIAVDVGVQGQIVADLEGFDLATMSVKNGAVALEVGLGLDSTGSIAIRSWMTDNPLNIDVAWEAALLAGILNLDILTLGADAFTAYLQSEVNDKITNGFQKIVTDAILSAPKIIAMLVGDDFTLTSIQIANQTIEIDYIAPVEPDPKPNPHYIGVIGRTATQIGPNEWHLIPPSLGNTWAADKLSQHIDHIVVVMMENRSFDHVLGYRQLIGDKPGDGGYLDLIAWLKAHDPSYPINPLKDSGITPDAAGLKTKFPAKVGHYLKDVAQQLASQLTTDFGLVVNSPQGFIDDFANRVTDGLVPTDVLGIYDGSDLPFYRFLAENYTYCDHYFSAHPGPTLPNRMYALGGDVQYDRVGEAILDNNNADNFALSRSLNIFDVLTRKSIPWRVYESFPSVTMLRFFARYLGDNTNIVPIANLQADIAASRLPPVTFIEPALHHAPENDDHPIADMLDGQIFVKSIYDGLRANEPLWLRTLLIISYDEHGGFYDHVVPSVAEIRSLPLTTTGATPESGARVATRSAAPDFKAPLTTRYGLRVPAFVISPWVPAGNAAKATLDHCSILKTILARFCADAKPFLTDRVNASLSFNALLTETQPRLVPPSPRLPSLPFRAQREPAAIATKPLSKQFLREGADFHDLTGMLGRMLGRPYTRPDPTIG